MRDIINSRIKRRKMFRPFAPAITEEATPLYFEQRCLSLFMLMTSRVKPEKQNVIPGGNTYWLHGSAADRQSAPESDVSSAARGVPEANQRACTAQYLV
jgi:Carbamoyltransferase C-terminus